VTPFLRSHLARSWRFVRASNSFLSFGFTVVLG
jgi:hypothetical protein